jgi:hypothetical protein
LVYKYTCMFTIYVRPLDVIKEDLEIIFKTTSTKIYNTFSLLDRTQ